MPISRRIEKVIVAGAMTVWSMSFGGCDSDRPHEAIEAAAENATRKASEAPPEKIARKHPTVLARVPHFSFVDSHGNAYGDHDLLGVAYVVNLMNTRSPITGPKQAERLLELQKHLVEQKLDDRVRLVSISVDPDFDNAQVLASYAESQDADPKLWKFLRGDREGLRQLSEGGLKLMPGDSPNEHDPRFALVDPAGRLRGLYQNGNVHDMEALRIDLRAVVAEGVFIHRDLVRPEWLEKRRRQQIDDAANYNVRRDFQFTDRLRESGIAFRHRVVDDAGRSLVTAHYDHGNGLAVADIDGDGRLDIYFVNQVGGSELYRNLGEGRFENVTAKAGVALEDRIKVSASFADIDNDGDADLFVTTVRAGNALFENDGGGVFRDISVAAGVDYSSHSSGAAFFDYNRDGLLDLFVVNVGKYTTETIATVVNDSFTGPDRGRYKYFTSNADAFAAHLKPERAEQSILYENRGGNKFVDVTKQAEIEDRHWTGDALAFDGNADGWTDLYLVNMQGHDEYYENQGGAKFVRKGREIFPATPWGSMGIETLDFENDGRFDLFLTDMHTDMQRELDPFDEKSPHRQDDFDTSAMATDGNHVWGNAFFRNRDGKFDSATAEVNAETYWPWGLSVGDLNADGFEDAFVTASMNFPYRYGINSLLLNERGERFRDAEFVLGVEPRRGGRTATPWFELDAIGDDRTHPLVKARQGGATTPTVVAWGALGSRSSAIFDLEGDGDLDIVTSDFNSEPMVLVSDLATKGELSWLSVDLIGAASNRDALGAIVAIKLGDQTLYQVRDGKSGYLSQSRLPLYFGLGDAKQVDSIEVTWPGGKKQTIAGPIENNRRLEIREE